MFAMLLGCLFKSSGIDYDTLSNDLVEWKKDCYDQSNQNPISSQINFNTVKFEKILSNGPEIASFLMQKFKDGNGELIVFFPNLFLIKNDLKNLSHLKDFLCIFTQCIDLRSIGKSLEKKTYLLLFADPLSDKIVASIKEHNNLNIVYIKENKFILIEFKE